MIAPLLSVALQLTAAVSDGFGASLEVVSTANSITLAPGGSVSVEFGLVNLEPAASAPIISARLGLTIVETAGAMPNAVVFGDAVEAPSPLFPGPPISVGAAASRVISVGSPAPLSGEVLEADEYTGIATVEVEASASASGRYAVLLSPFDLSSQFDSGYLTLEPLPTPRSFANTPHPEFGPSSLVFEVVIVPEPQTLRTVFVAGIQVSVLACRRGESVAGRARLRESVS